MEIYLTDKDIEDIELDPTDEWDVESQSVMVHIGDNLRDRLVNSFALTEEEKEGFENYGWLDVYAEFDINNKVVNRLYVVAFLGDAEKTLSFELQNDPLHSYNGDCLYEKFCRDESFVEFTEEILKYQRESTQMNMDRFREALDIFKDAFKNLGYYIGKAGIDDEFWCPNKYPFEKNFKDMILPVVEWVEACKQATNGIKEDYKVCIYMSDAIPNWNGDNNLATLVVDGKTFYQWYLENAAVTDEDKTPTKFNHWYEEIYDADMVAGLYKYAMTNEGIVEVYEG